jgi:pimeloyl-ACP methyl ester carboxylesterase
MLQRFVRSTVRTAPRPYLMELEPWSCSLSGVRTTSRPAKRRSIAPPADSIGSRTRRGSIISPFDPEHPGFGGSDTPAWLDTIGDLAYFYLDFLEKLGLKNLTLVGSSLGGWTATEMSVRNTSALRALVLSCPAGIHVKGQSKGDIFLWNNETTVRNLFHDQKFADAMLAPELTEDEQMVLAKNKLTSARLGWQPRLYNPHLYKWLHRIAVPTLLLWGDHDKVIPPAYGPAFRDLIPGSKLVVFESCGHVPHVEKMEEWTDEVIAFAKEAKQ